FPALDKQRVLESLGREAKQYPWFRSDDWAASPFGALATKDMEPTLLQILTSPSRGDADQSLLNCALDAVRHGEQMPSLTDSLEKIVRDASYMTDIRRNATRAIIYTALRDHTRLLQLTRDIHTGLVQDGEDELLGTLLSELYPGIISPAEIFDCLHKIEFNRTNGQSYDTFWEYYLPERSRDDHLPMLLDKLAQVRALEDQEQDSDRFDRMEGELLVRGIEAHGDAVSDERLYAWLGLGSGEFDAPQLDEKYAKRIATWFGVRPERYKALIEQLIAEGKAYYCYASSDELDTMREAQRARGEKPRYDGRWRPEQGKALPTPPDDIKPVVRFRNPTHGVAAWDDLVKGKIMFENA
ncbi:MAG: glutamate--tRNA ligase family protein, partial [Mariprofundaceae bacterium]|nr:glutamate--tRNA ligase family protein [Mariprofundaceae bacterium]